MSYESPRIGKKGQPYETVTAEQHKEKKRREAAERNARWRKWEDEDDAHIQNEGMTAREMARLTRKRGTRIE